MPTLVFVLDDDSAVRFRPLLAPAILLLVSLNAHRPLSYAEHSALTVQSFF